MLTPFEHLGVKYPSYKFVMNKYQINYPTLMTKLHFNLPLDINKCLTLDENTGHIKELIFKSESDMLNHFNIKSNTFNKRLEKGFLVEESLLSKQNFNGIKDLKKIGYRKTIKSFEFWNNIDNINDKRYLAYMGLMLNEFYKDPSPIIRSIVAKQGKFLQELSEDDSEEVIIEVVKQGFKLEKYIKHPSFKVRKELANQGYALDTLKKDKDYRVRIAVIKQNYALDELSEDSTWLVRLSAKNQLELR